MATASDELSNALQRFVRETVRSNERTEQLELENRLMCTQITLLQKELRLQKKLSRKKVSSLGRSIETVRSRKGKEP